MLSEECSTCKHSWTFPETGASETVEQSEVLLISKPLLVHLHINMWVDSSHRLTCNTAETFLYIFMCKAH